MGNLNDEQKISYPKRSYSAVDGLWFLKVEDSFDFAKALKIDNKVWEVVPKIQARLLKSVLEVYEGLEALELCFAEKSHLGDTEFEINRSKKKLTITISHCHWRELMINSNREHFSSQVGEVICTREYSGWAQEFGADITFKMLKRICNGAEECILRFSQNKAS